MPPRCADMPPAATAEPHASRKVIDGRWAHARSLGGMMHMCPPPMLGGVTENSISYFFRRPTGRERASETMYSPW
eukprot:328509-Prymnesium_polylepis.1